VKLRHVHLELHRVFCQQDRPRTNDLTMWRVHVTTVVVEKQ